MSEDFDSNRGESWTRAYIGLGSNEGDRLGYVQQAMQLMKDHPNIEVVECSSLYETEPVGNDYVEWFVNAVAAIETNLAPRELMKVCKEIEKRLSSLAGADGPTIVRETLDGAVTCRIIDLDILFYGDKRVKLPELIVPHPQLTKRAYALVPLLEIAPELRHPVLNKTVSEIHENLDAPEQVFLYGTRNNVPDFEP
ncbi:MAG: 2-amino-4-hydroxy-6-hydroxymethyldihydropteridine diphosphokinase [Candidatus Obscuribacterales bacterium]|nr:2-amino-4-hydroxy-6-hydroxymethyldihydropteridine diphosphokinase [Candidatus Obscuribacterales bacterium]